MGGDPIPGPHVELVEYFEATKPRVFDCENCYGWNPRVCGENCPEVPEKPQRPAREYLHGKVSRKVNNSIEGRFTK